jgi:hypothetical protein
MALNNNHGSIQRGQVLEVREGGDIESELNDARGGLIVDWDTIWIDDLHITGHDLPLKNLSILREEMKVH